MDLTKGKETKRFIVKTWKRCISFRDDTGDATSASVSRGGEKSYVGIRETFIKKSKSWPRLDAKTGKALNIAPKGCFFIYVGPQRQRFVMKTENVTHPLFIALLEEAEVEYGYRSDGPLELPCEVDDFVKVLLKMDVCDDTINPQGCIFSTKGHRHGSYHHLPSHKIIANE